MEVAVGLVSLALAMLGVILVYIYRTNGRYMRALQEGQREIAEGVKDIARIARDIHQGMERMTGEFR